MSWDQGEGESESESEVYEVLYYYIFNNILSWLHNPNYDIFRKCYFLFFAQLLLYSLPLFSSLIMVDHLLMFSWMESEDTVYRLTIHLFTVYISDKIQTIFRHRADRHRPII